MKAKFFLPLLIGLLPLDIFAVSVIKINGAGATFPYPIYSKWFSQYEKENKGVKFNYQAIGSGGGIRQLIKKTVDFGASDAPLKAKEQKKADWPIIHVPTVLGAVAVSYNLPGVKGLRLDGKTLAQIFLGEVNNWGHPSIAKLNPQVKLPSGDILVVRRADGSGTTAVFSDYLAKVSPAWKKRVGVGKTLRWPAGIGAKGNDGVTNVIKQTTGSIGYVELAYAINNKLETFAMQNRAGEYVIPTPEGISASSKSLMASDNPDVTQSITDAEGPGVYPISAFTYILIPQTSGGAKLREIKRFLLWALSEKGQSYTKALHYAPLPTKLAQIMQGQLKGQK